MRKSLAVVLSVCVVGAASAFAETPCRASREYGRLDFMLGDWDIIVNNRAVAWARLEKDGGGCVIREQFNVTTTGQSGAGIIYWDPGADRWQRLLVTSYGYIEPFEGTFGLGDFVWIGEQRRIDGAVVPERVVIRRDGDDILNDIYQSEDGGNTWVQRSAERRIRSAISEGAQNEN